MSTKLTYEGLAVELGQVALQRDTYRDLCGELLSAITEINNVNNQIEIFKILEDVMSKARSILGEKNGTAS